MSILCARGRGHANFTRVCVAGDHLPPSKHICITFILCWTNVEDVGPTLYKCYTNVLCLLGW